MIQKSKYQLNQMIITKIIDNININSIVFDFKIIEIYIKKNLSNLFNIKKL